MLEPQDQDGEDEDRDEDAEDEDEDQEDNEVGEVRDPQVLRTHGVTKIYQPKPGGLITRCRILVEDADAFDVHVVIEHDNKLRRRGHHGLFGGR